MGFGDALSPQLGEVVTVLPVDGKGAAGVPGYGRLLRSILCIRYST